MKNKSDKLLIELISNQKKNIPIEKKLSYNDLKRVSKYLVTSIFDSECSIWNGYITVIKNDEKNSYINFYFNGKKYALHRILYLNYIGDLADSEYIKFSCNNKGKCCNISHFYKVHNNDDISSKGSRKNSLSETTRLSDIANDKDTYNTELNNEKTSLLENSESSDKVVCKEEQRGNSFDEFVKTQTTKSIIVDFDL